MKRIIVYLGYLLIHGSPIKVSFWNLFLYLTSHHLRLILGFKTFTPSNTGLEKKSEYPELGSAFKAAFMKASAWFFATKAVELSNSTPEDCCKTIGTVFLCWSFLYVWCSTFFLGGTSRMCLFCFYIVEIHQQPQEINKLQNKQVRSHSSTGTSQDNMLRLIATCLWRFHHAVMVMDHADILLSEEEAEEFERSNVLIICSSMSILRKTFVCDWSIQTFWNGAIQ